MRLSLFMSFGLLVVLTGCSAQAGRDGFGIVEGKITYQNKPLSGGSIHFFKDQERVGSFMIRPDGSYAAEIPLGQIKVAIETVSVKYQDRQAVKDIMKEHGYNMDANQNKPDSPALTASNGVYVDIPERYRDSEQSGLECKVERGRQTCDFDLK